MIFRRTALLACILVCLVSAIHVRADDFDDDWGRFGVGDIPAPDQPGFHAVERVGFTVGGDIMSTLTHADGTIRQISGGGLYQIGIGALYRYPTIPFSLELTLNYHYDSDYSGNDNADFRRIPAEALLYFNGLEPFRIGAGTRYVYSARANSTINGVTEHYTFQNAHGTIIEIGYEVRPHGWVNLRYVKETYYIENYYTSGGTTPGLAGNIPYDGSHWGFFITYEY